MIVLRCAAVETDEAPAFHHTRPFWPVHILGVPKRHVPSLMDLGDECDDVLASVMAVARSRAHVEQGHGGVGR